MCKNVLRVGVLTAVGLGLLASPASADLVASWKLDEPAGTEGPESIEDAGPAASHHGTPSFTAGSTVAFGAPGALETTGTAAAFSAGSIDVPYDPELNPESFTFAVWAKADSVGGFQSVVTSRHDAFPSLAGYILYGDVNGNWNFWTGRSGGWDELAGGPVMVDTWTHLAISFDAETGTKTLYVDGLASTTTAQMYVPNALRDLHLGGGGDLGVEFHFDGSLDDAALWSVALSADDVLSVMGDGVGSVPDDLVAHWALDEPEGTAGPGSVEDSVDGLHDGGIPGAPFQPGGAGATPATGGSIAFSNASIDVPYASELNPDSFTVTAWAKPDAIADYQSVITSRNDIGQGQQTQGFIIYAEPGGNWAFWTGDGDPGWAVLAGPPVEVGSWQHVAISFDAATLEKKLYVNGLEVALATDQRYAPNVLRDLHIGGGGDLGDQYRFRGSIDDVGLWDEALPAERIREVMEEGVTADAVVPGFRRGDPDASGDTNITDGIFILNFLFLGGPSPSCADSADADDGGTLNITDGIFILNFLFLGGAPPAAPYEECGEDPSGDDLDCASYPACG